MLFHLLISVLAALLLLPPPQSGSSQPAGQPSGIKGFPVLPPIPTADSSIRRDREFRLPASLDVKRTDEQMSLSFDDVRPVKLKVGKGMVTGLKQELRVYRDGKLVVSGYHSLESGRAGKPSLGVVLNKKIDKIPQPGETTPSRSSSPCSRRTFRRSTSGRLRAGSTGFCGPRR
jgi:hypothetical protein